MEVNGLIVQHEVLSSSDLKRLMLVYDRLYFASEKHEQFLLPDKYTITKFQGIEIAPGAYLPFYRSKDRIEDLVRLQESVGYATSHGIIKSIGYQYDKIVQKDWLALRLAYEYDTANDFIVKKALELVEKDPRPDINLDGVIRGLFVEPSGAKVYPSIPDYSELLKTEESHKYRYDLQVFSIIGRLNRDLIIAGNEGLVPVFTDTRLAALYDEKIKTIATNPRQDVLKAFKEESMGDISKTELLLQQISEVFISDESLESIPVDEFVIARNRTFDSLLKLRRQYLRSIGEICKSDFQSQRGKEIAKYLEMEIMPLINLYNSKTVECLEKFLKYQIIVEVAVGTAALSYCEGLSPLLVCVLTGISAVVGERVSRLPDYLREKREKEVRNTYGYFINFQGKSD